jgi:hypothetical protein
MEPDNRENSGNLDGSPQMHNLISKKLIYPEDSLIIGLDLGGTLTKMSFICSKTELGCLEKYVTERVEHEIIRIEGNRSILNAKFLNKYREEILEYFAEKLA